MVGQEMCRVLSQRKFPVGKLKALASDRSVGMTVRCNGDTVEVEALREESFQGVDIALFSAGSDVSITRRKTVSVFTRRWRRNSCRLCASCKRKGGGGLEWKSCAHGIFPLIR